MSEKRFTWKTEKLQHSDDEVLLVVDNVNKEWKGHILNIVALLNEQQTTICKLQDLCGESDGENAKLRLKNKELQEEIKLLKPVNIEQYEQIVQLQEENNQLKNRLNKDL